MWIGAVIMENSIPFPVQSLSRVRLFATPWTTARQASLSITNSQSSPKPMSTESVMPSNHLILCRPLLLLPSIFLSIRVFSNQLFFESVDQNIGASALASVLPGNIQGWFPLGLTAAQGTLKSLLQQHSSKASIPQHSAFFMVQLSHPYMTTGKTRAYATLPWTRPPSVPPPQSWACGPALLSHVQP